MPTSRRPRSAPKRLSSGLRQRAAAADEGLVTTFARLLLPLISSQPIRRLILAGGLASTFAAALLVPAPAAAIVTTVGPTTVGLQPRVGAYTGGEQKSYANPGGNPVLHGTGVYAIYWDPTDHYWSEWQSAIDNYLQDAGSASGSLSAVFAVDTQYTDKSNRPANYSETYKGAYVDYHAYPAPAPANASGCKDPDAFALVDQIGLELGGPATPACLTSAEVASELEAFIASHGLPRGLGDVYYVLTPPGVTVCLDAGGVTGHCSDFAAEEESYNNSFCSYHAAIDPALPTGEANTIVYAVIPWTAGGYGDGDLQVENDRRPGWDCQDGGINPTGKHGYELEKAKKRTEKEEEAFEKMDPEEQAAIIEAEKLQGPHEQEPNQKTPCPETNGTCDYGLSDLIINQIGLEQQNMVTDPLLNAWQDSDHFENTDECRFLFGPVLGGVVAADEETLAGTLYDQALAGDHYYLNDAFSLAALRLPYPGVACLNNVNLVPKFTAPNTVNSGEVVGFNGMESDIALDAGIGYSAAGAPQPNYATYTWNFGDGTPQVSGYAPGSAPCEEPWLSPCAGSVFHAYQYGGTYLVTLTVRDVGGNTVTVMHEVNVDGPPSPSATGAGGGAGGAGGGGGVVPNPVAAAAIVRQSLRSALRRGLVVSYSVNEQVAGHFEVLLSSAVARKLGIAGTPATGLPAGSPSELVIAKAILVTTKGGHSSVHIQFSKRTAARLAHVHKVALMLRLIVRNAATSSPVTTTVLSTATLTH
jgi:PKD domain